jgi:hypothetical protein
MQTVWQSNYLYLSHLNEGVPMTQLSLYAWLDQSEPPFWEYSGVIIWWGYKGWHDNSPLDFRCTSLFIDSARTRHSFGEISPSAFRGWYA